MMLQKKSSLLLRLDFKGKFQMKPHSLSLKDKICSNFATILISLLCKLMRIMMMMKTMQKYLQVASKINPLF